MVCFGDCKEDNVRDAIAAVINSIVDACTIRSKEIPVRAVMAYGALVSGITLANAGLGAIHGLASVLGGLYPIPHGVACGTLLAPTVKATIDRCAAEGNTNTLEKFAAIAPLKNGRTCHDTKRDCSILIDRLYELTGHLHIASLGKYGVSAEHLDTIAAKASNKNNPVKLTVSEMKNILAERL